RHPKSPREMTQLSTTPTQDRLPRTTGWRFWARAPARKVTALSVIQSTTLAVLVTLACFAVVEIAVRIAVHAPLLGFPDFRRERAARNANPSLAYDSLLGWRLRPYVVSSWLNTIEHGIRSNGGPDQKAQQGGVLAVGSSFTIGSDVNDAEAWPPQLEQLSAWPVH